MASSVSSNFSGLYSHNCGYGYLMIPVSSARVELRRVETLTVLPTRRAHPITQHAVLCELPVPCLWQERRKPRLAQALQLLHDAPDRGQMCLSQHPILTLQTQAGVDRSVWRVLQGAQPSQWSDCPGLTAHLCLTFPQAHLTILPSFYFQSNFFLKMFLFYYARCSFINNLKFLPQIQAWPFL